MALQEKPEFVFALQLRLCVKPIRKPIEYMFRPASTWGNTDQTQNEFRLYLRPVSASCHPRYAIRPLRETSYEVKSREARRSREINRERADVPAFEAWVTNGIVNRRWSQLYLVMSLSLR